MSDFISSYGDRDVEVLVNLICGECCIYRDRNLEYEVNCYQTAICSVNGSFIQDYQLIEDIGTLGLEALNIILRATSTMYAFSGISLELGKTYYLNHDDSPPNEVTAFRINESLEFELM